MDEINDFFDVSKNFNKNPKTSNQVSKRLPSDGNVIHSNPSKLKTIERQWYDEIVQNEKKMIDAFEFKKEINGFNLSELENIKNEDVKLNNEFNQFLSIYKEREQILRAINNNPVVILQGETGCGKTTQVPQYILHDAFSKKLNCKIIVTQPRRIAAISLSERIANERDCEWGAVVGYKVGLHENITTNTPLIYCTTGVLLQMIINRKSLVGFTHIILDEVHERNLEMDFLLILIRRFLFTNSPNVKIILMSATIDTNEFADYFAIKSKPAPIIEISGERQYKLQINFLDDLTFNTKQLNINITRPDILPDMYELAVNLIGVIEKIDLEEAHADNSFPDCLNKRKSTLIFLPGLYEINEMYEHIKKKYESDEDIKLQIIRLHSIITTDEQIGIFKSAPPQYRKIILATNIAESSITVPDVKYVIDFCLMKYIDTESSTNLPTLRLDWISKANCKQRAGRAGRVMNGRVYHLVPQHFYDSEFSEFANPEMTRGPLDKCVLQAKVLDIDKPGNILALALTPPNLSDILNTIMSLKELGGLFTNINGIHGITDGGLTFIGRIMAALPINVRYSRLIIFGYIFSCLEDAIIMAAGLSVRSIFRFSFNYDQEKMDAFIQKLTWADGSGSDLIAILKAYKVWKNMREQYNMTDVESEFAWARRYFIDLRSMREMDCLIMEIKHRLNRFGITLHNIYQNVSWTNREKMIILKIIIAGAFYPNYFTITKSRDFEGEQNIYQALGGFDPCRTVFFSGFNARHFGCLYVEQIKQLFDKLHIKPNDIEVHFPTIAERIYVTFKSDNENGQKNIHSLQVPGHLYPEVHKAIKMRFCTTSTLNVMSPQQEKEYILKHEIGELINGEIVIHNNSLKYLSKITLPTLADIFLKGTITHVYDCEKFYFKPDFSDGRLKKIQKYLNDNIGDFKNSFFKNCDEISHGMIVAVLDEGVYYRVKVLKVLPNSNINRCDVFFIDYGIQKTVDLKDLRKLTVKFAKFIQAPPPIFECRLALIRPSCITSVNNKWCKESIQLLENLSKHDIKVEVYSVVHGVANVILYTSGNKTFNDLLIEMKYATQCDESYMSKYDHDLRSRKRSLPAAYRNENNERENIDYLKTIVSRTEINCVQPSRNLCKNTIKLKGPFTPLEISMYPIISGGKCKTSAPEGESVLGLMLDSDPLDAHDRLIVAADMHLSKSINKIITYSNTLMPNIEGFSALMQLLFARKCQLKLNKTKTKYVGVLSGLGYDPHCYIKETNSYKPLYAEHDIFIDLDTEITIDDIELINHIRYNMDSLIITDPGDVQPTTEPSVRAQLSADIKKLVVKLLNRKHSYIHEQYEGNCRLWEKFNPFDIIETESFYEDRSIFPPHSAIQLNTETCGYKIVLCTHCEELHSLKHGFGYFKPTKCRLCNQTLDNVVQLRLHLLSQKHKSREQQIGFTKYTENTL